MGLTLTQPNCHISIISNCLTYRYYQTVLYIDIISRLIYRYHIVLKSILSRCLICRYLTVPYVDVIKLPYILILSNFYLSILSKCLISILSKCLIYRCYQTVLYKYIIRRPYTHFYNVNNKCGVRSRKYVNPCAWCNATRCTVPEVGRCSHFMRNGDKDCLSRRSHCGLPSNSLSKNSSFARADCTKTRTASEYHTNITRPHTNTHIYIYIYIYIYI